MKTKKLVFFISVLLFAFLSCKKKDLNVLPPETQNQSFGCLLNNKVWVNEGSNHFGIAGLHIYVYKYDFGISAVKFNTNTNQEFSFNFNQPLKVGLYYFNSSKCSASFFDIKQRCIFNTDSTLNWGTLEITKYDTIQKKVMGRFSFKAKRNHFYYGVDTIKYDKDSIITITDGRFNIMY